MKNNIIQVICGPGRGKSTAALGRGISALTQNQTVIMVQFLKGAIDPSYQCTNLLIITLRATKSEKMFIK